MQSKDIFISIGDDFHKRPALRHSTISEYSGEDFYHNILNNAFALAIKEKVKLVVNLDTAEGYAISFLDESFGNLVYDFSLDVVKSNVVIISNDEPGWKDLIEKDTYQKWEIRRKSGNRPVITVNHPEWYRFINSELELGQWIHLSGAA